MNPIDRLRIGAHIALDRIHRRLSRSKPAMSPFMLNRDFPVDESTRVVDVVAVTQQLVEHTRQMVARVYGVGVPVVGLEGVVLGFRKVGERECVRVSLPLRLPDGGALLKQEIERQQQLARFARAATAGVTKGVG